MGDKTKVLVADTCHGKFWEVIKGELGLMDHGSGWSEGQMTIKRTPTIWNNLKIEWTQKIYQGDRVITKDYNRRH